MDAEDNMTQEEHESVAKFNSSIQAYKEDLYNKIIPDDEDGQSQTDEPVELFKQTLRDDADLLLRGEDSERSEFLSAEAKKYLLPFILKENTHNEFIEYLSAIRLNLITFPYTRSVKHTASLIKNGQ